MKKLTETFLVAAFNSVIICLGLALLVVSGCDSALTYRDCEKLCAPLKVEEYQPETRSQREACRCAKPSDGFITESNAVLQQPAAPDAGAK